MRSLRQQWIVTTRRAPGRPSSVDSARTPKTEEPSTSAWEAHNSKGDYVLQLWTSTNGGKQWSAPVDVAATPFGFEGPVRVAINDGRGFMTFNDDRGLELVTLDHLYVYGAVP